MTRTYRVTCAAMLGLAMVISPLASAGSPASRAIAGHRSLMSRGGSAGHESFASRLRADLADLLRRPAHMSTRDWEHLGLGLVAVGAASSLDTQIRSRVQRHRTSRSEGFANDIRPAGEWGALAALGVTWIVGRVGNHPNLRATAEDGFEASIIAAGLITPALKVVVGRFRPPEGVGAGHFSPVSGHHSFPSGEATEAFAVASVVAAHTNSRWLQGAAWGLAGLVGWERIELDRHWASDVVAGALIGAEVGRWVVARHRRAASSEVSVVILPVVAPGTLAVSGAVMW
ncbi:MAG: phosphatase PAP2 family protein [Acidobacteria bacterium]|nr:phosphatase PAP2 family protein [Acidobacteriota bacterium]